MTQAETHLVTLAQLIAASVSGATVERDRVIPFPREALPGIVIKPKVEQSEPLGNRLQRSTLTVLIEIHVRGNQPSSLADPLAETIQDAVTGSSALNGTACRIWRTAKEWEFDDADAAAGKLSIDYQLHYAEPV